MKPYQLHCKYASHDGMREKLYPLFETVFKIDVPLLQDFYRRGFWNPTYRPYTFFDGDLAVANVSMFSMPLMIKQKRRMAAGIQSVMTHPDYRGKGLMKHLFAEMLQELDRECETALLLTETPDLYKPFGFRPVQEHYFRAPMKHVPADGKPSFRKLDFFQENDVQTVKDLFLNHTPVSHQFAPVSHQSSFCLNMYHPYFHEKLSYSEELGIILVWEVKGETLKLYDVIGETLPTLDEICSHIPLPFSQIEFYFCPDLFDLTTIEPVVFARGNHLMVRGDLVVEQDYFILPITAEF
ncbi:GNAT family N-acetyltransferase [Brevibacillus sp. H7]|uniref:GNAT family N-acetyltransferase n=1 Tax=Brevibacillus sp. H7 TaxID=3349138 RepID=UPI003804A2B6